MKAFRVHSRTVLCETLLALAIFAAVVRALVPQGFMLSATADGPAITICTIEGSRTLDGAPRDPADAANVASPCAFAGIGALAAAPRPPAITVALAIVAHEAEAPASRLAPRGDAAHRAQAPRAPPSLHA